MVTNQSKHSVQFSSLAWGSEDPQFPQAWQVGRYLARYADTYCRRAEIKLGWRLVSATLETAPSVPSWSIRAESTATGETQNRRFDHLIVASGFFGRPQWPSQHSSTATDVPAVHSSQYRDLHSLLGKSASNRGRKILVVGGQMSGVEIAGTIASHLSSAINSPETGSIPNVEEYSIHHIIQRPIWVFPLYTSPKVRFHPPSSLFSPPRGRLWPARLTSTHQPGIPSPSFVPLDLSSYDLNKRPHPLTNTQGHITPEAAHISNSIFKTALGTNQSEFSKLLSIGFKEDEEPPYLAVSDPYMEFVRSGLITLSVGKLDRLDGHTATVAPAAQQIEDVAAAVYATGFEADSSLSFLPESILKTLSFSPKNIRNPIALAFHGTHHPSVPNLGFVGFYRSPYWGVMEMQARFLTSLWLAGGPSSSSLPQSMKAALGSDKSIQAALSLRNDPRSSQFPMGDYPFLMQDLAAALNLTRRDPPGNTTFDPSASSLLSMNILTPARYPSASPFPAEEAEIQSSLRDTHQTALSALTRGAFVAKAVFRSLHGEWRLERNLSSRLPTYPSGHFSGTAKFLLRDGTADGLDGGKASSSSSSSSPSSSARPTATLEYLYIEDGEFRSEQGMVFRATRRYVWRYDEARDKLSVWFVKTNDQRRADYLFHEVDFVVPSVKEEHQAERQQSTDSREADDASGLGCWEATAGHLCVEDFYDVAYQFRFQAVNLKDWRLKYTVKGPKKDYTIDGRYTRV